MTSISGEKIGERSYQDQEGGVDQEGGDPVVSILRRSSVRWKQEYRSEHKKKQQLQISHLARQKRLTMKQHWLRNPRNWDKRPGNQG
jgi:hypothetical protein